MVAAENGPRTQTLATPWPVVKAIEGVLGASFDLDVAAEPETAKAPHYYTKKDDGLAKRWKGLCWVNPPYRKIGPWVEKAISEASLGVDSVLLLPSRTSTEWFRLLRCCEREGHAVVAFWPRRIAFEGSGTSPYESSVAVYVSTYASFLRDEFLSLEEQP